MALTYFYAGWFGLLMSLVALSALLNRRQMMLIVRELLDSRAMLFIIAFVSLLVGILLVLTHNVWNQGLVPLIITLLGWGLILRSALILFLPHGTVRKIFSMFTFEQAYYATFSIVLLVGLFLAWNSFFVF